MRFKHGDSEEELLKRMKGGFHNRYDQEFWHIFEREMTANPHKAVLDIGCGSGLLLGEFRTRFKFQDLWGLDPNSKMIEHARAVLQRHTNSAEVSLHHTKFPANEQIFHNQRFDLIFAGFVLHEAKNLLKFVQEASLLLTPEGQLFLFEYERISLREYLEYWCNRKGKSRKSAFQKYPFPHVFSLDDLQVIIEEAGLLTMTQESISGFRILLGAKKID